MSNDVADIQATLKNIGVTATAFKAGSNPVHIGDKGRREMGFTKS